jgi:hypothetical protein
VSCADTARGAANATPSIATVAIHIVRTETNTRVPRRIEALWRSAKHD